MALAVALLIVSNVAYSMGETSPPPSCRNSHGPPPWGGCSGWGWSLGYVGGLLALGLGLAWVMGADARGSTSAQAVPGHDAHHRRQSRRGVGLHVRAAPGTRRAGAGERSRLARARAPGAHAARQALAYRDLIAVFACGTCYQAGVATVIALSAIYAEQVMGFGMKETSSSSR